jgi:hypothetical protein
MYVTSIKKLSIFALLVLAFATSALSFNRNCNKLSRRAATVTPIAAQRREVKSSSALATKFHLKNDEEPSTLTQEELHSKNEEEPLTLRQENHLKHTVEPLTFRHENHLKHTEEPLTFRQEILRVLPFAAFGLSFMGVCFQVFVLYPWHEELSK